MTARLINVIQAIVSTCKTEKVRDERQVMYSNFNRGMNCDDIKVFELMISKKNPSHKGRDLFITFDCLPLAGFKARSLLVNSHTHVHGDERFCTLCDVFLMF